MLPDPVIDSPVTLSEDVSLNSGGEKSDFEQENLQTAASNVLDFEQHLT